MHLHSDGHAGNLGSSAQQDFAVTLVANLICWLYMASLLIDAIESTFACKLNSCPLNPEEKYHDKGNAFGCSILEKELKIMASVLPS